MSGASLLVFHFLIGLLNFFYPLINRLRYSLGLFRVVLFLLVVGGCVLVFSISL
jgi:hypothetical protein